MKRIDILKLIHAELGDSFYDFVEELAGMSDERLIIYHTLIWNGYDNKESLEKTYNSCLYRDCNTIIDVARNIFLESLEMYGIEGFDNNLDEIVNIEKLAKHIDKNYIFINTYDETGYVKVG